MSNWSDNSGYTEMTLYPSGAQKSFICLTNEEYSVFGQVVKMKSGEMVKLYENGDLQAFILCENIEATCYGVAVHILAKHPIELFENGNIKKMALAKQKNGFFSFSWSWNYRGNKYPYKMKLGFSEDGNVMSMRS